jgi:2-phosphosulfolactate phosphatase
MKLIIEALLSPADYAARRPADFAGQTCVVFDVLRATSVMVTGLAHGAAGFVPVTEIAEALARRTDFPDALLAGERDGLRITAALSGGVEFDLGNSPREYVVERVAGRTIISTTTNGTRALRGCGGAATVLAGAFLNLRATASWLRRTPPPPRLVLVCAGTGTETALEDVLGAGALIQELQQLGVSVAPDDAAMLAWHAYQSVAGQLEGALATSRNGRRLQANAELNEDVRFCAQRDVFAVVAGMAADGVLRVVPEK